MIIHPTIIFWRSVLGSLGFVNFGVSTRLGKTPGGSELRSKFLPRETSTFLLKGEWQCSESGMMWTCWWFQRLFVLFSPLFVKWSNLTVIFFRWCWNHELVNHCWGIQRQSLEIQSAWQVGQVVELFIVVFKETQQKMQENQTSIQV